MSQKPEATTTPYVVTLTGAHDPARMEALLKEAFGAGNIHVDPVRNQAKQPSGFFMNIVWDIVYGSVYGILGLVACALGSLLRDTLPAFAKAFVATLGSHDPLATVLSVIVGMVGSLINTTSRPRITLLWVFVLGTFIPPECIYQCYGMVQAWYADNQHRIDATVKAAWASCETLPTKLNDGVAAAVGYLRNAI